MTVEQFIADLDELVDAVCARVGQEQVMLHGHSWGSALGVLYASRLPRGSRPTSAADRSAIGRPRESVSYAFALARRAVATTPRP